MNPAKFLDGVVTAIDNRQPSPTGLWHIIWNTDTFQAVPTSLTRRPEIIFGTYTHAELRDGLTGKQWDTLSGHIATFLHQKGLL